MCTVLLHLPQLFISNVLLPGRKKVWSEEIMASCDVICGADEKMVWCAFPYSSVASIQSTDRAKNSYFQFPLKPSGISEDEIDLV